MAQSSSQTGPLERKEIVTKFVESFVEIFGRKFKEFQDLKAKTRIELISSTAGQVAEAVTNLVLPVGIPVVAQTANKLTEIFTRKVLKGARNKWNDNQRKALASNLDNATNSKFSIGDELKDIMLKIVIDAAVEICRIYEAQLVENKKEKSLEKLAEQAVTRTLAYFDKKEEEIMSYIEKGGDEAENFTQIIVFGVIKGGKSFDGTWTIKAVIVDKEIYLKKDTEESLNIEKGMRLVTSYELDNFEEFESDYKKSSNVKSSNFDYSKKEIFKELKGELLQQFQRKDGNFVFVELTKEIERITEEWFKDFQNMQNNVEELKEELGNLTDKHSMEANEMQKKIEDKEKEIKQRFSNSLSQTNQEISIIHSKVESNQRETVTRIEALEQIREKIDPEKIIFPIVPKPLASFVERTKLAEDVISSLKSTEDLKQNSAISFPVVVLYATGGYGKTQLAKSIAIKIYNHFKHILWFNCESKENIKDSLLDHIKEMEHSPGTELENLPIEKLAQKFYNKILEFKLHCLIIFDNVQDFELLKQYLPLHFNLQISALITSRSLWKEEDWKEDGHVENIKVGELTQEESLEFAKTIFGGKPQGTQQLIDKSGRIALVLSILVKSYQASKTEADPTFTIEKYLKEIEKFECVREEEATGEKKNFIAGISYAVSKIIGLTHFGKLAKLVLDRISYLEPSSIESAFVLKIQRVRAEAEVVCEKKYHLIKLSPELALRNALKILENFALVQFEYENSKTNCSITIHRMVQECVQYLAEEDETMKLDTEAIISETFNAFQDSFELEWWHNKEGNSLRTLYQHIVRIVPSPGQFLINCCHKKISLYTPTKFGSKAVVEEMINFWLDNYGISKAVENIVTNVSSVAPLSKSILDYKLDILDLYCNTIEKYLNSQKVNKFEKEIYLCIGDCFRRPHITLETIIMCIKKCRVNINNEKIEVRSTFLYKAVANGNYEKVDWLLKNGANIDLKVFDVVRSAKMLETFRDNLHPGYFNRDDLTKMLRNLRIYDRDYIKMLLELGADPSVIDEIDGMNAFHYLADELQIKACEVILEQRPELLYSQTEYRMTAFDLLIRNRFLKRFINMDKSSEIKDGSEEIPRWILNANNANDEKELIKIFQRFLNRFRNYSRTKMN